MKINNFSINFKGYDAQKIKALYMQEPSSQEQKLVYIDLYDIGKKEGFDVFINSDKSLISHPVQLLYGYDKNTLGCDYWAQDNKVMLNKNGETEILTKRKINNFISPNYDEACELAEKTGFKLRETPLLIEGGNIFIGKNDKGDNYLITGKETVLDSAIMLFLHSRGVEEINTEDFANFYERRKLVHKNKQTKKFQVITMSEFDDKFEYWIKYTKEKLGEEFDVKTKNITIISQPNFHIDLGIRPLEYPYVLVNDTEILKENLVKAEKEIKRNKFLFLKQFKRAIEELQTYYAHSNTIANELKSAGFVPIMIGGGYSHKNVNFINAIANKHQTGVSYITNSVQCHDDRYMIFQKMFEDEINKKYPKIDRLYYVQGSTSCSDEKNIMMQYLNDLRGGVHCLVCEQIDFE